MMLFNFRLPILVMRKTNWRVICFMVFKTIKLIDYGLY